MRLRFASVLLLAGCCQAERATDLEAVVTTDLGEFRFEFAPAKAPKHVAQFLELARQGFYDGSAFHRAVVGGLIQGGDPGLKDPKTPRELWGKGGRDVKMASEPSDLKHVRGTVSAVRVYDPNTDGTQFFICLSAMPALDPLYTPFGRVVEGLDIVEKISQVPVDEHNQTDKPVRILSVTIEQKKTR
jgi:peptidyl-prolyl cis-trans isomerase B (cyclophilin B)